MTHPSMLKGPWVGVRTATTGLRMACKTLEDQPGWYQVTIEYESLQKHVEMPRPILLGLQASISWAPIGSAA